MKSDLYLSFVVIFQLVVVVFQLLLPLYGFVSIEQASSLRVAVTFATFIPASCIVAKRNFSMLVVSFVFYAVFLLFNYMLYPASHKFIESMTVYTLTPISILSALFVISIKNFDFFLKVLLWISRFLPIVGLLYVWGAQNSAFALEFTYSMSFGYALLLPALYLFSREKTFDKGLGILLFVMIVLNGSRGPSFVAVCFFLYNILFVSNKRSKGKILLVGIVLGLAVTTYLSRSEYVESSRTVQLVTSGEFVSHDSGRDEIQVKVIDKIIEQPIFGWGMGSDRYFFEGYAHNIFLELLLHYGIVGGGLLIVLLFVYSYKAYFSKNKLEKQGGKSFFVMLFLCCFVPMLVSNSYLQDFSFALLVGYILRVSMLPSFNKKTIYMNNRDFTNDYKKIR